MLDRLFERVDHLFFSLSADRLCCVVPPEIIKHTFCSRPDSTVAFVLDFLTNRSHSNLLFSKERFIDVWARNIGDSHLVYAPKNSSQFIKLVLGAWVMRCLDLIRHTVTFLGQFAKFFDFLLELFLGPEVLLVRTLVQLSLHLWDPGILMNDPFFELLFTLFKAFNLLIKKFLA